MPNRAANRARVSEHKVKTFMGGTFTSVDRIQTVGQLREYLKSVDEELGSWNDDSLKIGEVHMEGTTIRVDLEGGITQ